LPKVFFVLGGPGSGKGTQCANLKRDFAFKHLSAGDLLRAERNAGGPNAALINSYISDGKIVPIHITVNLIKDAMEAAGWEKEVFLIDGFPRSEDNLQGWNAVMDGKIEFCGVIYFEADEKIMTERIMHRALTSGRVDDNPESLKKRFVCFREDQLPIIMKFASEGKVHKVDAKNTQEQVYEDVKAAIKHVM